MRIKFNLAILFLGITAFTACKTNVDSLSKKNAPLFLNVLVNQKIPTDHKIPMVLEIIYPDTTIKHQGSIERRGGFSISFPKHSYEIDLKKDVSIGHLPADDDWILISNYIDKTFIRHTFAYSLFCEMHRNNKASLYTYAELSLNGSYNGLYLLMEKLDKSSLGIIKQDKKAVVFKEPPLFRSNIEDFVPQNKENYHQQVYPKIKDHDFTLTIEKVRAFIVESNDSIFNQQIKHLFDIQNLIDWHLLLLLTKNNDGLLKNFYLYKVDSDTPFRIAPWDYDHSFGRDGDNELNLEKPIVLEKNILFKRLLLQEWYQKALEKRWHQLNEQHLFSVKGLKARVYEHRLIINDLVRRNFEKWPVNGPWYYDDNKFEDEINIILNFIDVRHKQLSDYFGKEWLKNKL